MSAIVRAGAFLDGQQLADATQAVEFQVNVLRRNADGAPVARRLLALLDFLREANAASCERNSTQLSVDLEESELLPTDLMTTAEVAQLMNCSTSNVRARAGRESLWSTRAADGSLRFSRADVLERMAG